MMKLLNIKRAATLILALCLVCFSAGGGAAQNVSLPDRKTTLSELFRAVERQTDRVVIFKAGAVEAGRQVALSDTSGTLAEVLDDALSTAGYEWRANGRYVVVRNMPQAASEVAVPEIPQPSGAAFEQDVREYTEENIHLDRSGQTTMRYDTIRIEKAHDGVFRYPDATAIPELTDIPATTPFVRNNPPLLAVKTNLVWWAFGGTPNLAGEIGLGKRTTIELAGGNNRWNLRGSDRNNRKMVHWVIKPEFRYWLCERFNGHFFGVHGLYGRFNVGGHDIPLLFEKEYRYEGDAWGAGVSYGYNWAWSKRWGMEFTAGLGVMQMDFVKKDCERCGSEIGHYSKTYFGPTSLGVKVIFMIK